MRTRVWTTPLYLLAFLVMEGRHRRVFRSWWVGHAGTHSNKQEALPQKRWKANSNTHSCPLPECTHICANTTHTCTYTHYLNKQEQLTVKMDKQQVTVHRRKEHRYFQLKLYVQWKPLLLHMQKELDSVCESTETENTTKHKNV